MEMVRFFNQCIRRISLYILHKMFNIKLIFKISGIWYPWSRMCKTKEYIDFGLEINKLSLTEVYGDRNLKTVKFQQDNAPCPPLMI